VPTAKIAAADLALHDAAAKVSTLLREQARLLREAAKKKQQLASVQQKAEHDVRDSRTRMAPLLERHDAIARDLRELFENLLADERLPARARRQLLGIRSSLDARGVLSPWLDAEHHRTAESEAERRPPRKPVPRPSRPELAGARQVGQERRSLRELFRNVARAINPDQARNDAERAQRTALMKEASRAYEDGDLARLLELESTWQKQQAITETIAPLPRCRELERMNRELLDQLRALTRQLRDTKLAARAALDLPSAVAVERELAELQLVYEFVCRFRDGKLTLAELSRGPLGTRFAMVKRGRPQARAAARRPS
jgi:hypothetical protein